VSKASLSRLVYARDAAVYVTKTDRYGRLVGKVVVDGRDAGLEQCSDYGKISPSNRQPFASESDAIAAGYRKAGNCP
jgi:hypothetical protein